MKRFATILLLAGTFVLAGCGSSNDFTQISGQQGNNPNTVVPVAVDDAYNTNQNQALVVNAANGVLANDTPNGGTITAFDATSTQNGTVALLADGGFTYTPVNGFTGTDTFTYTLSNNAGSDGATVTITVQAVNGFFVDSVNGSDTTGSFQDGNPYQTIQAAVADAPTNADIVVRPGSYTGAVNLKDGQRLLGSGSTLVNAQGAVRPQLTGPVVLADGNTLDFLRVEGTNGDAIDGNGQNGGTVTNCEVANITNLGRGVVVEPGEGTWNISNNDISNVAGIGIDLTTNNGLQMTAIVNNNVITNSGFDAISFVSENTSQCTAQVHGNVMAGNQAGATFEVLVGDTATFCLDLENNTNDDVYRFAIENTATANVEQFNNLEAEQVSGTVTVQMSGFFGPPTNQADGFCGF